MTNLHFGILVVLICLGNLASASFSNEGTEFYVGFMNNDFGDGRDMYLYMTTGSNTPAEVTVTAPKQDTNFRKTVQVARGQSVRVSIPANFKATGSQVENKGIHVMSSQPISLYGLNQEQGSGDAFTAIPVTGLGSRYSAITWSNQGQILVVSTQDRTEVRVKLPGRKNNNVTFNGVLHTGYAEFTVTMSRYQTLHLQSDDLTATQIVANSAITVFSGSKKVQIEGTMTSDHLVQQLTPYDAWGKEFLISAPPNSQKYKMKIVSQDRHPNIGRVYISGEAASGTFVTEFYTFVRDYQSDVLRRVWSDSPIQVALFTQSMDSSTNMIDASMVLVPPVYQYRSRYTFTTLGQTAAEMSSHMTIYVANVTTNAGTLRMDGQPMNVSFTKVASTDYYLGTMPVSPGAHEVYSTDPLTNFYGLISGFHASSNGNYYVTYPAGMNVAKNTLGCSPFVGQNIVAGNQVDEDCDGRVDEEIKNNIDDDGDGKVDEDLSLPSRANGNWGPWGSWEACSVTCENGTKSRRRLCNNPEPINGGLACPTDIQGDTDTVPCSLQRCPECDPVSAVSCTSKPNTVCSANRFCECEPGYRDTTGLGQCVKREFYWKKVQNLVVENYHHLSHN
ncbi:IgGFc-binding protein-like [Lingula anatina]|uniref:IgGFc-binding protein-like n=1 Tax=Lingula anatina TaxID=7574 RepID=A0A1S3KAW8_LINAN|nr:IgGFc-binding protein-like [Lingula anatina]|eukprot:XP_013419770.1 IgGFc-binding protein-like [Lingula anatina]